MTDTAKKSMIEEMALAKCREENEISRFQQMTRCESPCEACIAEAKVVGNVMLAHMEEHIGETDSLWGDVERQIVHDYLRDFVEWHRKEGIVEPSVAKSA